MFAARGSTELIADVKGADTRNEGSDWIAFGRPHVFWPPPIVSPEVSGDASFAWECSVAPDKADNINLEWLEESLSAKVVIVSRR